MKEEDIEIGGVGRENADLSDPNDQPTGASALMEESDANDQPTP